MGKKRSGKKGGVAKKNFKVVGSKDLKVKNKTKPVKTGLKKVSKEVTKQKLQEIDEQLVTLQDNIVKKPEQKKRRNRKGKHQRARMTQEKLAGATKDAVEKVEKMEV
ncbi:uncharacterized protein LOC143920653 [Arctopsyche grandis]|uniref:uncharacterized protein LOC143920653 n=1 Tax=Arctopsyche grandis TaxID=121162 RepID=UPI00406D686E